MLRGVKFLIIILVMLGPHFAMAVSAGSVTIGVTPVDYGPNENVTINLSSFAANLDSVNISWTVNGKAVGGGIGKKYISTTSGAPGEEVRVVAKIYFPDGEIEKSVLLRPNIMAILWQASDSYVPPFYRGKALPTEGGEIKVVAIPEIRTGGTTVNPKNLTYSWKKDYNNEVEASGYGKNFFLYTNDYLEDSNNIGVIASTTDGQNSSTGNITVSTTNPEILFYKRDGNLETLLENTVKDGEFVSDGDTLVTMPYFISPADFRKPELVFSWLINGSLISVPAFNKNLMPLRIEAGSSGMSRIRVEIENKYKISQSISEEIILQF